jgi:site-specific recombinase XerD
MKDPKLLPQLVDEFIQDLKGKSRSPSTILAYGSDLTQLTEYLAHRAINQARDVKAADLDGFRDHLLAHKYTPKSTSRKLNAVKTFFRWLKDEGYVDEDVSRDVRHPEIHAPEPKFLSPIEYRALRDTARAENRVAAIIELILQTGMRISEVANLKLANLTKDLVTIEPYATQSERQIPLNRPAREAIEAYLRDRRDSDSPYLFVSKNGKPLAVRNIRASIDKYLRRAGLSEYSVNDLRNTFIVESLKRGVDLVTISQAAGHRRLSTTERYLQISGITEPGKKQFLEEL